MDFWENSIHEWENVDFVSVMSDGVNSFFKMDFDKANSISIPYVDVIIECNNLKNRNGVFMQRRIKSMNRKHSKENIYHYDDFSIASIMNG